MWDSRGEVGGWDTENSAPTYATRWPGHPQCLVVAGSAARE